MKSLQAKQLAQRQALGSFIRWYESMLSSKPKRIILLLPYCSKSLSQKSHQIHWQDFLSLRGGGMRKAWRTLRLHSNSLQRHLGYLSRKGYTCKLPRLVFPNDLHVLTPQPAPEPSSSTTAVINSSNKTRGGFEVTIKNSQKSLRKAVHITW